MSRKATKAIRRQAIAERMDQKKEAIMRSALQLFASHGFHATAVGVLADKAGVAAGTIYRYFENKESLVNELFAMHKRQFLHALKAQHQADISPREQFRALWTALYKYAQEHEQSFAFLELQYHATYLGTESLAAEEEFIAHFRAFFTAAQKGRFVKAGDPDLLIMLVLGAFTNIMKQNAMRRLKMTPQAAADAESACWDLIAHH